MTMLSIAPEDRSAPPISYSDPARIVAELAEEGILFERWAADRPLAPDASQDDVLGAYAEPIARLSARFHIKSMDVVRMWPEHPGRVEARQKFLDEHTHDDFEIRFFVEGSACFYLHIGDAVYTLICEAGDLLSVPTATRHWFDMGPRPSFTAIRLFTSPDGWVPRFTGSAIARSFPPFGMSAAE